MTQIKKAYFIRFYPILIAFHHHLICNSQSRKNHPSSGKWESNQPPRWEFHDGWGSAPEGCFFSFFLLWFLGQIFLGGKQIVLRKCFCLIFFRNVAEIFLLVFGAENKNWQSKKVTKLFHFFFANFRDRKQFFERKVQLFQPLHSLKLTWHPENGWLEFKRISFFGAL